MGGFARKVISSPVGQPVAKPKPEPKPIVETKAEKKYDEKKRRGRRDRNDPGFLIPLGMTGSAGVGILAKQLLEDRKKNRTGGR